MRDRNQPAVRLGKELQLNLIELRKADRLGLTSQTMKDWTTFFEHWREERIMANITYRPVQDALERLKVLSADEETRRLAFVRERALHDEASLLKDAKEEGRTEGMEEAVVKMLNAGMAAEDIANILGLGIEQITEVQKRASTLNAN